MPQKSYRATGCWAYPRDKIEKSRLAGTIRPDQPVYPSRFDAKSHCAERFKSGKPLSDGVQLQHLAPLAHAILSFLTHNVNKIATLCVGWLIVVLSEPF